MNRRGIVAALSPHGKIVAIETEERGFTLIDVESDTAFAREEIVEWKDSLEPGIEVYRNVTRQTLVRVKVRGHGSEAKNVTTALALPSV